MMKASSKTNKQSGFFDMGLSLLILAMAGGTALMVESGQQQKIETAASQQSMTAEVTLVETGDSVTAVQ